MKKIFFSFVVLFLLTSAGIFAQVGIKAGVQLATMLQEDENISQNDLENHAVVAPVAGLIFDLNLSKTLTIQPELLYAQSGGRNRYTVLGASYEETYRINYLELPVLAKLELGNADNKAGRMGFYVAAGPWIGVALNGKSTAVIDLGTLGKNTIETDFTFDDEDNTRRTNYGLAGAVGLNLGKIALDVRYNYGLNNLLDNDTDNTNDNKPVLQTRGIALTLGYHF